MRPHGVVVAALALLVVAGCATASTGAGDAPPSFSSPTPTSSRGGAPTSVSPTSTPTRSASSTPTHSGARPSPSRATPTRPAPTRTSTDQVLAQLEAVAETAAEVAVAEALAAAGITLATGPDCTADLTLDASGRSASGVVACTGTTTQGLKVKATLTGSFAAGACDGRLVVTVAGRTVVDESVTECPGP